MGVKSDLCVQFFFSNASKDHERCWCKQFFWRIFMAMWGSHCEIWGRENKKKLYKRVREKILKVREIIFSTLSKRKRENIFAILSLIFFLSLSLPRSSVIFATLWIYVSHSHIMKLHWFRIKPATDLNSRKNKTLEIKNKKLKN